MKYLFLLLSTFCFITVFGQVNTPQNLKYAISKPYTVVDGEKWYFSVSENEVISLKKQKSDLYYQKFSGNQLDESKHVLLKPLPEGAEVENVIHAGENIHLFYSLWDKSAGNEQLFVRSLYWESETVEDDKLLIKVDGKVAGKLVVKGFMNFTVQKNLISL